MLNAEKYRSQILEFIDKEKTIYFSFKNDNANMLNRCCESNCNYCALCPGDSPNDTCAIARIKWLLSEYKEPIKLTRLEFEILKWLDKGGYKFIVRSNWDNLLAYDSKPEKKFSSWGSKNESKNLFENLFGFKELFQFVQWKDEEPTSIQDVLKNCEVVDDDTDKRQK